MAECVSCGKEIPAGKFFCADCYVKMKGRRGPSGEVPPVSAAISEKRDEREDMSNETEPLSRAAVPTGVTPVGKASGAITPASVKKVVTMKSPADKAAKEKAGKKRFAVTITFSERTYAALNRLKIKKEEKSQEPDTSAKSRQTSRAHSRRAARRRGPYGRPMLKAVAEASSRGTERRGGFMGIIGYRERTLDRGDVAAIAMAVFAVLSIIVLSFLPWVRISLGEGQASGVQTVKVTGMDLGAIIYVCITMAVVALLYMAATWRFKGVFSIMDFGVAFILAGVVIIPLFYIVIASNARILAAALEQIGRGGSPIPEAYERQTIWPAYMMVFSAALLAFAGLVRLSERKSGTSPGE
jgi:hypothetical protein